MNKLNPKKLVTPADGILIGVLIVVCLLFYFFRPQASADSLKVIVEKDGAVVMAQSLDALNEPVTVSVPGTALEVKLTPEGAAVISSDCPDQTCVRTGVLDNNGDAAICLPNQVVVRLVGNDAPAVDGITG